MSKKYSVKSTKDHVVCKDVYCSIVCNPFKIVNDKGMASKSWYLQV